MTLLKLKPTSSRELLRDSMISSNLMNVFDSFFNEAAGKFERNVFFTPRTDIIETANVYELHLSLPGVRKEDIQIEMDGDRLLISGERKLHSERNEDKYHLVESFYGKFSKSFTLPEHAQKEAIEATMVDGILTVKVPKNEAKPAKTNISIK
ncbi:MAG: Hsp20/alpha crystallin family protein [Bacteroidia bacterium]|jgi:HSP20 family protein|nr:Hsp20/alpha crystallin family protein [Bacteroidia bacterium]